MTGIYKIINKINKKVYIGESQNIERRWEEHKQDLIEGKHHSYKLQQDYDLYGEDDFEYEVIEELDSNIKSPATRQMVCLIYEDKYIKQCNSIEEGYNIENTLQRILDGKRGVFNEHQINKNHIKMLEGMIEYIKRNNGVYISSEEKKKQKKEEGKKKRKERLIKEEQSKKICIYMIKNIKLNKFFIGKSTRPDKIIQENIKKLKEFEHTNCDLQSDFKGYGENNFKFSILKIFNNEDEISAEISRLTLMLKLSRENKLYNEITIENIKRYLNKLYNQLK